MAVTPVEFSLDPLIAEAKQRAWRRRLLALAAAGLIAVGLLAFELSSSGTGGGAHGAIPWLPTKPNIGPAHPPLAPACTASQLKVTFDIQGFNMYEALGWISLVNAGSTPCSLTGRPHLSLAGPHAPLHVSGSMGTAAWLQFDPLAPPVGSLRAFRPDRHVSVALLVSDACFADVPGACSGARSGPLVFDAPGGGTIRLLNTNSNSAFPVSRDDQFQATRFTPVVPIGPPSSALPLRARIVLRGSTVAHRPNPYVAVRRGPWLPFTVVLTNHSARTFSFRRSCPAYTEQWGVARAQAYVLNCRSVGSILPGKSVAFAMRARVPYHDSGIDLFSWTLSPHTYHAPQASAFVRLR